ncbi:pilus assembly protein [Massilia sp. AB1]|uniref:pilus assembly protein n=1 Tax=Massilia sp. AB1 TaxID=2823371 RepID=UPI001B83E72E|nr:PilC/PilY family type IV pilus protein [Massilia sp. AB1]MBQ5940109.1 PQQ-binding-like beta-propeller repeat protein [Massilia sp. AB1]
MFRHPLPRALAFSASLALLAASLPAGADDIDIFTGASAGNNINPRILIVLDNTSNWARQNQKWPGGATQGQSEVNAIKRVVAGLDDTVNLGMMEFVTVGNANLNGGFIRYAVQPMDLTNRTAFSSQLTTIYNSINSPDEKRNSNTPYGNLMYDVYNYLAGGKSVSPGGVLSTIADRAGYTTAFTQFKSPLSTDNACGKTYVIFIGNPNASGPTADDATNTAELNKLNGNTTPVTQLGLPNFSSKSISTTTTIGTTAACYANPTAAAAGLAAFASTCSGYTDGCKVGTVAASPAGTCAANTSRYNVDATDTIITNVETGTYSTDTGPRNADEWARLMHDRGVPIGDGTLRPSVTTYTIDVYNAQPNSEHTSLMLSMARAGGGKYFAARNEDAIVDAIKEILIEIQAVNTTFASTSLPVNATNRSQNENQVFIGMFRPDPDAKPRWFGNLKRYQLITSGSGIDLGDVNKKPAVNANTGFVTPCATSFWTSDSGAYWSGLGLKPDPAGTCSVSSYNKYSDAPDGAFVEKGAAAQILRQGNVPAGTGTSSAVNRNVLTQFGSILTPLTTTNSLMDTNLVKFIRGEDTNNEKGGGPSNTTRPSIHGDVIHSRPLPVNYGGTTGVTVYYGANDGTLRALNAATGVERWAFIAPEFFPRLSRLKSNLPLVAYPNQPAGITPAPTAKDYFFDGSTGVYQNADSSRVWIYPTMRRGGRMIYALDVSNPDNPQYKWKAGCPNLGDQVGCTAGMEAIGQTWSTPSVAFLKGYNNGASPVVVVGGGYDACEDGNAKVPSCGATKGNAIYVLDADTGAVLRSFSTERAVAADIAMVDINNDAMPDYAYAADTGGNLYRIDFTGTDKLPLASGSWTKRMVARTSGGGRKFLFAPALLATQGYVYVAIGSGDREHPLATHYPFEQVTNRFYVYKDDLSVALGAATVDLDGLQDVTATNSASAPAVLPAGSLKGWYMDLNQNGQGEQVVTSALIAGGMVTFSSNRPIKASAGTCATTLGEARGYWVNLLNGCGAIGVAGTCGGERSSPFVGGGLPPSPVLASGVPIDGKATTVVIGAVQKGSDGAPGASVPIAPQKIRPAITSKRKRTYSYTSGAD